MPAARSVPARVEHGPVQRPGALRSAGDQQHRQVGAEPEVGAGGVAESQPVQAGDLAADRDADVAGVGQPDAGLAGEHPGGQPGADPVGQAGLAVGLVHHDRHAAAPGGQVAGGGHVPAEAGQHVGPDLVEDLGDGADRAGHPARHRQQLGGQRPGQRHRRDQRQVIAAPGDQRGLQAALGAQAGDRDLRIGPPQRVGQRERGLDMTAGAAARDDYAHRHPASLPCLRCPGGRGATGARQSSPRAQAQPA